MENLNRALIQMIWLIRYLASSNGVTSIHTLEPGDIVATGTNHGGLSALMDGDQIDMEIDGLGSLHLYVQDDLKRTWSRETRLDRSSQGLEGTTPQLTGKYSS